MPKLSKADEQAVAGLVEHIDTVRLQQRDFWWPMLQEFQRLLRAELPLAYGVRPAEQGPKLTWFHWSKPDHVTTYGRALIDRSFAQKGQFGLYAPLQVEPRQRNRALVIGDIIDDPRTMLREYGFGPFGLAEHDQVRVLICEHDSMISWVGALRPDDEPFTQREVQLLQRLVPSLQRRLKLEAELTSAPLACAALDVALASLGRAAVIVDARGQVVHLNAVAQAACARDRVLFAELLQQALAGDVRHWELQPIAAPGVARHVLLVEKLQSRRPRPPLEELGRRWALTPREREVLELVVTGLSNRAVAVKLECAERTVEVHVARLLAKSGASNRSELIAQVWRPGTWM